MGEEIVCSDCRLKFEVVNDIPQMLLAGALEDGDKRRQSETYSALAEQYVEKITYTYPALWKVIDETHATHIWARYAHHAKVLDLGSGHGVVGNMLSPVADLVVNFDIAQNLLLYARGHGGAANQDYIRGDAEQMPFVDDFFDLVTARGALHHLPHPETAIREVHRVLKPGGHFFFREPNPTVITETPIHLLAHAFIPQAIINRYLRPVTSHFRAFIPSFPPKEPQKYRWGSDYRKNHPGEPGIRKTGELRACFRDLDFRTILVQTVWFPVIPAAQKSPSKRVIKLNLALSSLFAKLPHLKDEGRIIVGHATK